MPGKGSYRNSTQSADAGGDKPVDWMKRDERRQRTHKGRGASRKEWRREQAMTDWYGPEQGRAEIAANRSSFDAVGDLIQETFYRYGLREAVIVDELQNAWEDIVGTDVSRVSRPLAAKGAVLEVEVTHPAWLYVLDREHRKTLEEALQKYTDNTLTNIRLLPAGRRPRR